MNVFKGHKTTMFFICLPLCMMAANPSPGEILNYSEGVGRELIYGTGFEEPKDKTIKLGEGFRYAPEEGNNGNCGLRCDRVGKNDRPLSAIISLPSDKVIPGMKYRVELSVKGKNIRHVRRAIPPASYRFLEVFYTDAKTGARSFENRRVVAFAKPPAGEDFQKFSCTFPGIEGTKTHLRLALWIDFLGTIWFDDLRVYREGAVANAFLTYPACSTFFTDSGSYKIKLYLPGQYRSPIVLVEFLSGGKTLHQQVLTPKKDWLTGDFGKGLPKGTGKLRLTLADKEKKIRLKTVEIPVFIREREKLPAGACPIDAEGFMLRDGKRFLPLGLFFAMPSNLRAKHLKRIGESPYNFIIDYSALSMAPASDEEKVTALRKGMDQVWANRLKIVFSLIGFYRSDSNIVKRGRWSGETTIPGWTAKLARSLMDHPALMGYYLTDELSAEQLTVPIQLRQVLNREDPYHPTFTLTNLPSELPDYARSGDIVIVDPYPLTTRQAGSGSVKAKHAVFSGRGQLAGTPVWATPQGFSWGTLGKNLPKFKDFIDPSEEDMRTLMLLSLVNGAKGICLYIYPFQWNPKTIKERNKYGLHNYSEDMWRRQVKAGAAVKKLEPYFISSASVPGIKIENKGKAEVKARLWKAANGKTALVIIGTGGGAADAVITVTGCGPLKSQFKHTVPLGGGRYHFTSADLASDMLFE